MTAGHLVDDLDRLVDRLRRMPEARLARPVSAADTAGHIGSDTRADTGRGRTGTAADPGARTAADTGAHPAADTSSGSAVPGAWSDTVAPAGSGTSESVADAAHRLAQLMADAARGVDGRAWPRPPEARRVPRLGDLASADLVAVTGADLTRSAQRATPDEIVWLGGERRPLSSVLAEVAAEVSRLRRLT